MAASIAARSALMGAAVEPVDAIAVAPLVIAAGRRFARERDRVSQNCASRNAATPAATVSRTVRSASGSPSFRSSSHHDDLGGLIHFLRELVIRGRRGRCRRALRPPTRRRCPLPVSRGDFVRNGTRRIRDSSAPMMDAPRTSANASRGNPIHGQRSRPRRVAGRADRDRGFRLQSRGSHGPSASP